MMRLKKGKKAGLLLSFCQAQYIKVDNGTIERFYHLTFTLVITCSKETMSSVRICNLNVLSSREEQRVKFQSSPPKNRHSAVSEKENLRIQKRECAKVGSSVCSTAPSFFSVEPTACQTNLQFFLWKAIKYRYSDFSRTISTSTDGR